MSQPTEPEKIPRAEWDFKDCPEKKLVSCEKYEYTRQVVLEAKRCPEEKKSKYKLPFLLNPQSSVWKEEWPKEISQAEVISETPVIFAEGQFDPTEDTPYILTAGGFKAYNVFINWAFSKKCIKAQLSDFVDDKCPKGIKPTKTEIGRSINRIYRASLNALAVYRLQKVMHMSEALELSKLYRDGSGMYRAKSKAVKRLRQIEANWKSQLGTEFIPGERRKRTHSNLRRL